MKIGFIRPRLAINRELERSNAILEQTIDYFKEQVQADTYSKLVESLTAIEGCKDRKAVINIVSPSASLAQSLATRCQQNLQLRSRLERRVAEGLSAVCEARLKDVPASAACKPRPTSRRDFAPEGCCVAHEGKPSDCDLNLVRVPESPVQDRAASLFEFQIVSPIDKVGQIVRGCDLICLIYYFKHSILKHYRRLIELAQQENVNLILLVREPQQKPEDTNILNWLAARDCTSDRQVRLALDTFIDLNDARHLDLVCQQLVQLSASANQRLATRTKLEAKAIISDFFQQEIADVRQEIAQLKQLFPEKPHAYRQRLRQIGDRLNREKQQTLTAVRQNLNCSKSDLLNPFKLDSLLFMMQQLVYFSHVKLVREGNKNYLYLIKERSSNVEYLHDYILDLCQQKVNDFIATWWQEIDRVYAESELNTILEQIDRELKIYSPLATELPKWNFDRQPSLDLKQVIDYECLRLNSRIAFDYNFSQSSWFRLLILILIGLGIYLVTWIYFGSGKSIGFVIVVFQIINLITGQSIKKNKLKQHSKELKRTVDLKYQSLIRYIIERTTQTLIATLEREDRLEGKRIERAIATVRDKLEEFQQTSNELQQKLDRLRGDRDRILYWFDSPE